MKKQIAAKVMQNYTICIPKIIRQKLNIKPKDFMIVSFESDNILIKKAPSSWASIAGIGKKAFKKYGDGEKFLKKERKNWKNDHK